MKKRAYKVVLLCICCLGISGILTGCGDDDDDNSVTEPNSGTYTFSVPGNTQWTNTALELTAGNVVTFTAEGTVFYLEDGDSCGPEGAAWTDTADQQDPLWQQPHAGLIGKIGETGAPFFIGASYSLTLNETGTLYLGINDAWIQGNSGEFSVTVEVSSGT